MYVPRIISHRSDSPLKFINVDRCDLCTLKTRSGILVFSVGDFGKRTMKNCAGKNVGCPNLKKRVFQFVCVCSPFFFGWKVKKKSLVKSREPIKKSIVKIREICWVTNYYLEPQTTIYKWLFQLDDSKSLYRKMVVSTKNLFIDGCLGFQVLKYWSLSERAFNVIFMAFWKTTKFSHLKSWMVGRWDVLFWEMPIFRGKLLVSGRV